MDAFIAPTLLFPIKSWEPYTSDLGCLWGDNCVSSTARLRIVPSLASTLRMILSEKKALKKNYLYRLLGFLSLERVICLTVLQDKVLEMICPLHSGPAVLSEGARGTSAVVVSVGENLGRCLCWSAEWQSHRAPASNRSPRTLPLPALTDAWLAGGCCPCEAAGQLIETIHNPVKFKDRW